MPDPDPDDPSSRDRPHGEPDAVDVFVRRIRRIVADPQIAARVSAAGLTVRIDLSDLPDRSLALLFDRNPPSVEESGAALARPTVRLLLDSRELDAMLNEGSHLPMAILGGAVTFEGSVRKFLRVMPILRGGAMQFDTDEEFEGGLGR